MSSIPDFTDPSIIHSPDSFLASPPTPFNRHPHFFRVSHTVNPSKESIESQPVRSKNPKSCIYTVKTTPCKYLDDFNSFLSSNSNHSNFQARLSQPHPSTEKIRLISSKSKLSHSELSNSNANLETIIDKQTDCKHELSKEEKNRQDTQACTYSQLFEPASPNFLLRQTSIRDGLTESMRQFEVYEIIDFYSAFESYLAIEISDLKKKRLWKRQFLMKFCSCFRKNHEINGQCFDICEKFVGFAYTEFNNFSVFHRNLMISAGSKVFDLQVDEDLEVTYNKLIEKIRCRSRIILSVFFNVLFLDSFFDGVLQRFKDKVKEEDRMKIIYKLSKLNIDLLRKKKMNKMLRRGQKTLELIFFVFAGIFLYYIHILNENQIKSFKQLTKFCDERLEDILSLSRDFYIQQSENL